MAELIAPPDPKAALRKALAALKVFPLHGVAVLPGTPAPFHVFEPRYRALVKDALAGDRIVAIPSLFGKSDAHALRPPLRAVCGAGIIEVEDRYDDGRYDIVLRGVARVRLLAELPARKLYREFKAELLEDELPEGGAAALEAQLESLRQLVYELSTKLPAESTATLGATRSKSAVCSASRLASVSPRAPPGAAATSAAQTRTAARRGTRSDLLDPEQERESQRGRRALQPTVSASKARGAAQARGFRPFDRTSTTPATSPMTSSSRFATFASSRIFWRGSASDTAAAATRSTIEDGSFICATASASCAAPDSAGSFVESS